MKLLGLLALAMSLPVHAYCAEATRWPLPKEIHCASQDRVHAIDFRILKLDSASPEASLDDQSFQEMSQTKDLMVISFTNECDNMYELVFLRDEIEPFARSATKQAQGMLKWGNAVIGSFTTLVTCK